MKPSAPSRLFNCIHGDLVRAYEATEQAGHSYRPTVRGLEPTTTSREPSALPNSTDKVYHPGGPAGLLSGRRRAHMGPGDPGASALRPGLLSMQQPSGHGWAMAGGDPAVARVPARAVVRRSARGQLRPPDWGGAGRVFWYSDRLLPRATGRWPHQVRGAEVAIIDGPGGLPPRRLVWLITYGPPARQMGLYETRGAHDHDQVRRLRDMLLATLRMAGYQPRVSYQLLGLALRPSP